MLSARFAPFVIALLLSGCMSCIVTLVASLRTVGLGSDTVAAWLGAWQFAWPVAFSVMLVLGPFVRKCVWKMVPANERSAQP